MWLIVLKFKELWIKTLVINHRRSHQNLGNQNQRNPFALIII